MGLGQVPFFCSKYLQNYMQNFAKTFCGYSEQLAQFIEGEKRGNKEYIQKFKNGMTMEL